MIAARLQRIGSRLRVGSQLEVVDPNSDTRYRDCWTAYHELRKRHGVTIDIAKSRLRNDNTIIGAMLVRLGHADGMICGLAGRFAHHLRQVDEIIGKAPVYDHGGDDARTAARPRALPLRHACQ